MKKSLFAIAAVTAFAGAAQAQSSVTVYGILDVGFAGANQRVATPGAAGTVSKGTASQFQSGGAESTNRIGFRGNEDLGGGTSAQFVFESSLNTSTETWSAGIRQGWAGLTQKGIGAARIGTQNTLIWQLAAPMTVGQLNNVTGSVINATNVDAALTDNANGASGVAFTNRTQRTLQLDSERIAGFQGKAMYVMNDVNTTQTTTLSTNNVTTITGGTNNRNGWGLSLDFTGVKNLRVAAAYMAFNADNPYTANTAQTNGVGTYTAGAPTPVGGNGMTNAANVKDNQMFAAATYNFGILTAYANYVNRKVTSQQTSNVYGKRSAQEIGVRSFITPKVEGWASVGNGRYTLYGANSPTANIAGYQLGANYWLSKRTNLYAIYGQAGTTSTSANAAANTNNYAVGARHTF